MPQRRMLCVDPQIAALSLSLRKNVNALKALPRVKRARAAAAARQIILGAGNYAVAFEAEASCSRNPRVVTASRKWFYGVLRRNLIVAESIARGLLAAGDASEHRSLADAFISLSRSSNKTLGALALQRMYRLVPEAEVHRLLLEIQDGGEPLAEYAACKLASIGYRPGKLVRNKPRPSSSL